MSNLLLKFRATHSSKLERWLGVDKVNELSQANRGWYGSPITVGGVPGAVYVGGDGDFCGPIKAGQLSTGLDYATARLKRALRSQLSSANAGFSTIADLISEVMIGGKRQELQFNKTGTTGSISSNSTLWYVGAQPAAGAAAGAAPGGTIPTNASTGALAFNNVQVGGDFSFFVGAAPVATIAGTLLLYDRLFSVTKTMASTATEAVTGVPTRYTSTTAGAADSAENNALIIECRTILAATAHNWTVCTYTDQSGNTGATLPSITGNSTCPVNRLDQPAGAWFNPLASGDTGIKALTQMQCSASVATGAIDFTIARPLVFLPIPLAAWVCSIDGVNTGFSLTRIFDNACLAFLEVTRTSNSIAIYNGTITVAAG